MLTFWIGSIALALLAALFILLPMFKLRELKKAPIVSETDEQNRQNVEIFRERLREIDNELAVGKIDAAQHANLKAELELALLDDVTMNEGPKNAGSTVLPSHLSGFAVLFLCFVIGGSYIAYFEWGSYQKVEQQQAMQFNDRELQQARAAAEQGDMDGLVKQLYDKLQTTPDNIEGWMLLSRTAMNMERFDLAVEGFQHVIRTVEAQGERPAPLYGLLAQSLYFNAGGVDAKGQISVAVQRALDIALSLDPVEPNALGLKAIHAFDSSDYKTAIVHWQSILAAVPDHPARASIESGMARAQSLLGASGDSAMPSATDVAVQENETKAAVEVTVLLDDALRSAVSPDDFVFIFARAESGPPMPLAASRHQVRDLPVTVTLDDSKAMAPMATLSQVQEARIVARVSKSGQPIAQAGDLEGRMDSVPVWAQKKVSIVIDTRL